MGWCNIDLFFLFLNGLRYFLSLYCVIDCRISTILRFLASVIIPWNFSLTEFSLNSSMERTCGKILDLGNETSFNFLKMVEGDDIVEGIKNSKS